MSKIPKGAVYLPLSRFGIREAEDGIASPADGTLPEDGGLPEGGAASGLFGEVERPVATLPWDEGRAEPGFVAGICPEEGKRTGGDV